jgi:hypothetical protein
MGRKRGTDAKSRREKALRRESSKLVAVASAEPRLPRECVAVQIRDVDWSPEFAHRLGLRVKLTEEQSERKLSKIPQLTGRRPNRISSVRLLLGLRFDVAVRPLMMYCACSRQARRSSDVHPASG